MYFSFRKSTFCCSIKRPSFEIFYKVTIKQQIHTTYLFSNSRSLEPPSLIIETLSRLENNRNQNVVDIPSGYKMNDSVSCSPHFKYACDENGVLAMISLVFFKTFFLPRSKKSEKQITKVFDILICARLTCPAAFTSCQCWAGGVYLLRHFDKFLLRKILRKSDQKTKSRQITILQTLVKIQFYS